MLYKTNLTPLLLAYLNNNMSIYMYTKAGLQNSLTANTYPLFNLLTSKFKFHQDHSQIRHHMLLNPFKGLLQFNLATRNRRVVTSLQINLLYLRTHILRLRLVRLTLKLLMNNFNLTGLLMIILNLLLILTKRYLPIKTIFHFVSTIHNRLINNRYINSSTLKNRTINIRLNHNSKANSQTIYNKGHSNINHSNLTNILEAIHSNLVLLVIDRSNLS